MDIAAEFMSAIINAFEANKRLADRAVEQVPDDKLHVALDANTNSIAVIMKHVAGNLTSRWTDFLTTDGEKPWRNRDDEFVDSFSSRAELLELLGAWLGLFAEDAQEPEAGRPRKDGPDPWGAAFRAAGPGTLAGPHLLPHRPDRSGRPNPRRGEVEHADDPQGRLGTVQQGELGPDREIAFVIWRVSKRTSIWGNDLQLPNE